MVHDKIMMWGQDLSYHTHKLDQPPQTKIGWSFHSIWIGFLTSTKDTAIFDWLNQTFWRNLYFDSGGPLQIQNSVA